MLVTIYKDDGTTMQVECKRVEVERFGPYPPGVPLPYGEPGHCSIEVAFTEEAVTRRVNDVEEGIQSLIAGDHASWNSIFYEMVGPEQAKRLPEMAKKW